MAVPAITGISPTGGSTSGGAVVSITGTALSTATAVHFGTVPSTEFASLSATQAVAVSPAGTGTVHVTLTTSGGTSATSVADLFAYGDGLFTLAQARAFDRGQLGDTSSYPDAAIIATEAAIRERFRRQCGVSFVEMSTTDIFDGVYSRNIQVSEHNPLREQPARPIVVTAASVDSVSLDASDIADLVCYPDGNVFRQTLGYWFGSWPNKGNVSLTWTHGWATVPAAIERAALIVCSDTLLAGDYNRLQSRMSSFSDGAANFQLVTPSLRGAMYMDPEVNQILSEYDETLPGIA